MSAQWWRKEMAPAASAEKPAEVTMGCRVGMCAHWGGVGDHGRGPGEKGIDS